jgi:hypothetical protein
MCIAAEEHQEHKRCGKREGSRRWRDYAEGDFFTTDITDITDRGEIGKWRKLFFFSSIRVIRAIRG